MSAAALVLVIGGIYQARTAMESSLIAVFLAMLGTPPVLWLERRRFPSVVAVLLVVAGMVAVLLILGAIAAAAITNFYSELPAYQARLQGHVAELQAYFASKGIRGMDQVLLQVVNPDKVLSLTPSFLAKVGSVFKYWGFLAFLLNYVPSVGSSIAATM